MQLNTLYRLLAMMVNHSPALDIAETFLTIPDWLNYWLTGEIACELSNATTQCYAPRQRDWSTPLLDAMHIPRRIFPNNCTNEGGVGRTFRFSKNIAGLWLVQECRRHWTRGGEEISYDELAQWAAQAQPFGAVIDVDDASFLKPGLDFNPSLFAHPKAASGFTLASYDKGVRKFWIEHCIACRKIGEAFGRQLGSPCITNIWIPDGLKDTPANRRTPRELLRQSLDLILEEKIDPLHISRGVRWDSDHVVTFSDDVLLLAQELCAAGICRVCTSAWIISIPASIASRRG